MQVPGLQDPQRLKELLGRTAKLEFRLLAQPGATDVDMLPMKDEGGNRVPVERRVIVDGSDLVDAQPAFDSRTNEPIVNFRFNVRGAQRFGQATTEAIGRPLAIVLDNEVISAPTIQSAITGGAGQISGRFTVQQVNDLSILLRAGALPAKLTIVEERTVGPGLGQDSIEAGKKATYVATIFVVIFMFATYGLFGLFANIALLVHVGLIFGLMSILEATLTLPGIAGIVLTIGTAVDFERADLRAHPRGIQRAGRSMVSAIQAGFDRAFATIVDSNSTMAIAAVILFFLGSGPVARLRGRLHSRHPDDGPHRRDPDAHDDCALVSLDASENPSVLRSSHRAPHPALARRLPFRFHAVPAVLVSVFRRCCPSSPSFCC